MACFLGALCASPFSCSALRRFSSLRLISVSYSVWLFVGLKCFVLRFAVTGVKVS